MAITFDTIANGQLAEKFRMALAIVGRNIMSPNADQKKARKITVELSFKPSGSGPVTIEYEVKYSLAGFAKDSTTFLIGQDARTGKIQMREYGSGNTPMQIAGEPELVQTEVIPPQPIQPFDPDTGEIYEPDSEPIDLRKAN